MSDEKIECSELEMAKMIRDEFVNRLEALEKIQLELKETLINTDTLGIVYLKGQIADLKVLTERNRKRIDELKTFRHHIAMPRIINLEEVLRELIKFYKLNSAENDNQYDFCNKMLEKLDSGGEQSVRTAEQKKEKSALTEVPQGRPLTDSKLPEPWPIENMEFTTLEEIEESIPKTKEAEPETHALDALLHAVAPVPLSEVSKLIQDSNKELIEEFLTRIDWILDRVVFHTENPDSELMDELTEEYITWQGRLNK